MNLIQNEKFRDEVTQVCMTLSAIAMHRDGAIDPSISKEKLSDYSVEKMLNLCLRHSCVLDNGNKNIYETFYQNLERLAKGELDIEPLPCHRLSLMREGLMLPLMEARNIWNRCIGYPLFHAGWVNALAEELGNKKCLEIMGGSGILSALLKARGVNISCTDSYGWYFPVHFCDVEKKDAETAVYDAEELDYLLVSWPPYQKLDVLDALYAMREKHPNCKMVYIGEQEGGNCAADEFFEVAEPTAERREFGEFIDPDIIFEDHVNSLFTNFPGMHDDLQILK